MTATIYQFNDYYQSGRYRTILSKAKSIKQHLDQDPIQALFDLSQALLDLEPDEMFHSQDKKVFAAYHQFLSLYQTENDPHRLKLCATELIDACYR
ncbi:MAG: hypothetical protein HN790_14795 [Methylococcales bacterium]|jgi:hypothetical protein|nr:hypothetical protein [Methylococcales bacterium]